MVQKLLSRKYRNSLVKERVYAYLSKHPRATNKMLAKEFRDVNINTLRHYKYTFKGSRYESAEIIEQLRWLYDFMVTKIIKGLGPSDMDRKRLQVIEKIIKVDEI